MWINETTPDIYLEESDLIEGSSSSLRIKVDKSIFDDYVPNTYINIQFVDVSDDDVVGYVMTGEDDDGIFMEMLV